MRTAILATLIAIGCMPPEDEALREHVSALSEGNGWDNGSLNGWNNSWANGSLNGWNNAWINGWANGWSNGSLNGFSNGSLNGWTNSWSQGWVNGAAPTSSVVGDGSKSIKRVRIEQGRVMADACITPPSGSQCPVDANGNGECCRRVMLLQGVYFADLSHANQGRWMTWYSKWTVSDSSRHSGTVDTTVVLDPCYTKSGVSTCDSPMNHLWQLAGPGSPMYPDCSNSIAGLTCNSGSSQLDLGITSHAVTVRDLFLASLSSLITTNGHYYVDIRWMPTGDHSTVLVPDPTFDTAPIEARWDTTGSLITDKTSKSTITERNGLPYCYDANAPQRAACTTPGCVPNLVSAVPVCNSNDPSPAPIATLWAGH
jgi:hypothetical protein